MSGLTDQQQTLTVCRNREHRQLETQVLVFK